MTTRKIKSAHKWKLSKNGDFAVGWANLEIWCCTQDVLDPEWGIPKKKVPAVKNLTYGKC